MRVVTQADIKEFNRLYLELKTYAAVARKTGFSPSTVKKYIVSNYEEPKEENFIRFEGPLPEFDSTIFRKDDWGDLCVLSEEEQEEVRQLWKEIEV